MPLILPTTQIDDEPKTQNSQVVRIFLVDDHEVVRDGLKAVFASEPDLQIVGESDGKDTEALYQTVKEVKPDLVLLDVHLMGVDGFDVSRQIKQLYPSINIIMMTGYDNQQYALEALRYEVDGFITKDSSKAFFINAIRTVSLGGSVWQRDVLRKAMRNLFNNIACNHGIVASVSEGNTTTNSLSSKELEVLHALGNGASNKEIGTLLQISEPAVKNLVHNVLNKLNLSSRTKAALLVSKTEGKFLQ